MVGLVDSQNDVTNQPKKGIFRRNLANRRKFGIMRRSAEGESPRRRGELFDKNEPLWNRTRTRSRNGVKCASLPRNRSSQAGVREDNRLTPEN